MATSEISPLLSGRPYSHRHVRFARPLEIEGWRLKLYTIATMGNEPRPELIDATLELAPSVFPQPPVSDDRHGIGFVIVHDAKTMAIALYYWWQAGNELHQRVFTAPIERPRALVQMENTAAGCVWELEVIDFERRAWIEDVLANPAGPDLDRYLARTTNADV